MQNFIFISPNYPESYWMFCRGLKKMNARVLAIVDTPYEALDGNLKAHIDESYSVSSFHNYDEVYKAVAYFSYKYGKPDWIESNNEAWLSLDARLRDDFGVHSGFSFAKIDEFQSKSAMKHYYQKAGLPVAPYCLPKTMEEAMAFGNKHGFDLVLKPDHGVGSSSTWHVRSKEDLEHFWSQAETLNTQMILEKFVAGNVMTLDGLADGEGNIQFLCSMEYVSNCMDSVQNHDSIGSYYNFDIRPEHREMAQKVVHAFGMRNRFFHGEYFKLTTDQPGLGAAGDLCALEMNFRPPGGFCPDLINYSYDVDIYDLWARVLLGGDCPKMESAKYSAGFVGRRKGVNYRNAVETLASKFGGELLGIEYLPPAFASAMGDVTIKARFATPERRNEFFNDSFERI